MTLTQTRAALAAALSTVAGVTGYTKRPSVLSSGDAWPLLAQAERVHGVAWQFTWRVVLVLSADEDTAFTQLTDLIDPVTDAINPIAYVDSATAEAISTSGGDLPTLIILARSE